MKRYLLLGSLIAMLAGCGGGSSSTSSASGSGAEGSAVSATAASTGNTAATASTSGAASGASAGSSTTSGAATGTKNGTITASTKVELALSGAPSTSASVGNWYSFEPAASVSQGAAIFRVKNAPQWARFDTTTGQLSGTPEAEDVGTYANIVISASVGAQTVTMAPFTLKVTASQPNSVALSWVPPLRNTNGSAITDLAGYHVYYGRARSAMTQSVEVTNPKASSFELANLTSGHWYISVVAYTNQGTASNASGIIQVSI